MMLFSALVEELRSNMYNNRNALYIILKKSPTVAYQKINDLAGFTGSRYNLNLQLHFPDSKKIHDIDSYGTENIGIVVDKFRKRFPLARDIVKQKATEILGNGAIAQDAYMYEGKEGVKVILSSGQRIEVLPGSVHFWCKINSKVIAFGDWLFDHVYISDI